VRSSAPHCCFFATVSVHWREGARPGYEPKAIGSYRAGYPASPAGLQGSGEGGVAGCGLAERGSGRRAGRAVSSPAVTQALATLAQLLRVLPSHDAAAAAAAADPAALLKVRAPAGPCTRATQHAWPTQGHWVCCLHPQPLTTQRVRSACKKRWKFHSPLSLVCQCGPGQQPAASSTGPTQRSESPTPPRTASLASSDERHRGGLQFQGSNTESRSSPDEHKRIR
jgi:hypothetical protein